MGHDVADIGQPGVIGNQRRAGFKAHVTLLEMGIGAINIGGIGDNHRKSWRFVVIRLAKGLEPAAIAHLDG